MNFFVTFVACCFRFFVAGDGFAFPSSTVRLKFEGDS